MTGQKVTGQSYPDWLNMTSPRTSKPNSGELSRFCKMKIGEKSSDKLLLSKYLFIISRIFILKIFSHNGGEK